MKIMEKTNQYFLSFIFLLSTLSIVLLLATGAIYIGYLLGSLRGKGAFLSGMADERLLASLIFFSFLMFLRRVRIYGLKQTETIFEPLTKWFANLGK